MSDPEQIKLRFPFRLSDVAKELGFKIGIMLTNLLKALKNIQG